MGDEQVKSEQHCKAVLDRAQLCPEGSEQLCKVYGLPLAEDNQEDDETMR